MMPADSPSNVCGLFPEGEWLLFVRDLDENGIPSTPFHLPYKPFWAKNRFYPWFLNPVAKNYGEIELPEGKAKILRLDLVQEAVENEKEKIMFFREKDLNRHYIDPLSRRVARRYYSLTPNLVASNEEDELLPVYRERLDMEEYFFRQGRIPETDHQAFSILAEKKATLRQIKKAMDYLLDSWNLDPEEYRDALALGRIQK